MTSLAPDYAALPAISNTVVTLTLFGSALGLQIAGWLLHEAKLNSPASRVVCHCRIGHCTAGDASIFVARYRPPLIV